ncbi:unnamed protein product [Ectocarpus sp. 12 AP-2014]
MAKKLTFNDEKRNNGRGVLQTLVVSGRSLGVAGFGWAQWAAKKTGRTGWVLLTTAVVTLVPLVFEITREAQLVEQEKIHINALLAEGKTRQEIAQMGLYSALDPNVMGPEAS